MVANPIIYRLVPSPSRYEIRQYFIEINLSVKSQNVLYSVSNHVCIGYLLKGVVCFVYCLFIWLRYIVEHMPKWNDF